MRAMLMRYSQRSIRKQLAVFLVQLYLLNIAVAAPDNGTFTSAQAATSNPANSTADSNIALQERLLLVDINGQQLQETVLVLQDRKGAMYLREDDLQLWRLRIPAHEFVIAHQGENYFSLTNISGASYVYDINTQSLSIKASPLAFDHSLRVATYATMPGPLRAGPGGFVNYDLFAAQSEQTSQLAGQFELGYFNFDGVGTSNVLVDNPDYNTRITRLDTTWTKDYPQTMQSLRVGDAINRPASWGGSLRFGGIQYATNFATQPGFVTFPPQSATGVAVLPSTVDVLLNNALVSSQSVPPGPFSISNLPIVSGSGEVQLVVRDMFGREQIITRPFYASQALLRKDLEDYSFEAGLVRKNFGINSFDYGSWIGSASYRRGLSARYTGEVHAEAMQDQVTAGGGGDYLVDRVGTISAYAAASQSSYGTGSLALLGIEHQSRPWSMGARTQWMSTYFAQLGRPFEEMAPVQLSSFNVSYASDSRGSTSVAYVLKQNRNKPDASIATLSYSVSINKWASFSISAIFNLIDDKNTTIFAMLNIPLGPVTSLSVSQQSVRGGNTNNSDEFTTTLQRNLPLGEGYGYRLVSRSDGYGEANYLQQNNYVTANVSVAQSSGVVATRAGLSGGVALLDGDAFFSRRIDQSFAVVRIPDYPNVQVLADNLPAGKTDADGNALIPRLRAYDRNVIAIEQRDIPMDAQIDIDKLVAVPYYRSGIDVKFPIKHAHAATLTVHLENGQPLPLGAMVVVPGNKESFVVGYEGEVYVAGLLANNKLSARWNGVQCNFDVAFVAGKDPLPDLGIFICKGAKP